MDKLPISLITIVRNAGGRLRQLIEAHKDIVSEIIVVDQGSTDGTYEEAKRLADKVFKRRPKGFCEPDRNWAFALGAFPYVLNLDDDEHLSKQAKSILPSLVQTGADIFWFNRKNYVDGVDIETILGNDPQCRLFKKGSVRFSDEIHRFPENAHNTKVFYVETPIIHNRKLDQLIQANNKRAPYIEPAERDMQERFIKAVEVCVKENKGFTENWYSNSQLNYLTSACLRVKDLEGQVLELGVWEGKSTCTIANTLKGDKVLAVDTWEGNTSEGSHHSSVLAAKERDVFSKFEANVKSLTEGNVTAIKSDIFKFLAEFSGKIKFCHIDASHDYASVRKAIEAVKPLLVKGAVLCGDDFMSAHALVKDLDGGVERAVTEMCPGFVSQENFWYWINS